MPKPTKAQLALMQQLDAGHNIDVIASNLGKSVLAVRQQIARLRKRIEAGHIRPAPLPIEKAAGALRVYLAGFDVFRIDAVDHGAYLKDLSRKAGYVGMYPFDNEAPSNLGPADKAAWICRANIEAIRSADKVMANLNDFRKRVEPDSGTAFEVGFAAALGKPIRAYRSDARSLVKQIAETSDALSSLPMCALGYVVEDFGLSVNLMLANSARLVVGGPADCLREMKKFNNGGRPCFDDGVGEA
ncbi:nucleoside 2-deoxyribosyltransferase [Caballeronia sp. DA-9]|uniref:nucleoside 2-deoxyribosyltransferase n=1 Tax=Caballeronia sp. DA-9 TaxID=3436237 RepID=UPI003F66772F